MPYGFVHAAARPADPADVYRLGDQAGVIPSFCGDGMAIALHTAFAAVAAHRPADAAAYHRRLQRHIGGQIGRATALYRLGRAAPGLLTGIGTLFPAAISWAAHLTRVPPHALLRPGPSH